MEIEAEVTRHYGTVGIAARVSDMDSQTARISTDGPVMKAGKPATFTKTDGSTIR